MDMDYKNLPYSEIKAEGASDCIIDLEAEPTSSTLIQSWYNDITQKIHKSTHYGNEKYVDDMMIMYYRSLKERIVDCKDKRQLKDQILTHIKYFYLYYKEIEHSLVDTNYFIRMEDILTCYCDLELEIVHNLSKHRESKKYFLFVIKKFCKVVGIYLYHNLKHILHVLLKMKYNTRNPVCQMVMRKIYFHFLMSLPVEPISDEVFCRYYLAFERYKEVAKQEEKKSISEFIFLRFGKKRDFVTTNSLMMKVLTPSCDSVTNIVSHLLDSMTTRIQTYFDHLKNNEMDKMNRLNTNLDSQCGSSDFLKTYNDVLCTFSEATIDIDSNTESTNKDSDSDIEVLEEEGTIVVSDAEDIDEIVYREKDVKHRHKTKKKKVAAQQRVSDVISLDSDDDLSSTQDTTPPACTIMDRLPPSPRTALVYTSEIVRPDSRMVSSENAATDTSSSALSPSAVSELNAEFLNLPATSSSKINTKEVSEEVPLFDKERLFTTTEDQILNTLSPCQASLRSEPIRHKQQSEISKLFTTPVTELPKLDLSQPNVLDAKTLSDLSVTVQKGCTQQECGINFSSPSFHKRQLPPPKVPVLFNAVPVRHRSPPRLNRVSEDITGALDNASHIMTELKLNEDTSECKKREFTSNPLFNLFPYARSVFSTQEQAPDTTQQSSVFTPSKISSACANMSQQICTASINNTTTSATLSQQRKNSQTAECVEVRTGSVPTQMSTYTSLLPVTEEESQKLQIDLLFSPSSTVSSINNVKISNNVNVITSESERTVDKESRLPETPSEPIEISTNIPLVTTVSSTLPQQIDVVPLQLETSLPKQSSVENIKVIENELIYSPQSDSIATKSPIINKVAAIMNEKQLSVSSKNICDAEPLTLPRVSSAANTLLVHTLSLTSIVSSQLITENITTSALTPTSSTRDIYEKHDFLLSDEFPDKFSLDSLTSCSSSLQNKQLSTQSSTLLIQVEEKDSVPSTVSSMKTAPTQHMSLAVRTSPSDHVEYQTTTKIPLSSIEPWLATTASQESLPFQHLLTNKNLTITEKAIPEQSKNDHLNPVTVSSVHDTSSINTLTSSVSLLNDSSWHKRSIVETSLSENSSNEQKSKNVTKENIINKQISIQTSEGCSNSSLPLCVSKVHHQISTKCLRSLAVENNNMESTVDESPNLEALPAMESTESTKKLFQITCSTSSSDLNPANYRSDNHDSDNDLYGYNYCTNKQKASVKQLSSSESVSYKFGMITPPSDPRSDKILTDLEDSEYDNIFGVERQTEDTQTFLHAESNLGKSCQDHPLVDTDVISKTVKSDKFSVKDIIIQRVESVPNDDLNISFSDREQNENSKCNSASEQDDDFFDVEQDYVKDFYLANDDLHGHNHDDGLKDDLENIMVHKIPMNVSTNELLEKADTLLSTCVFGDNDKMQDYEENVYEGRIISTEYVQPKFEVEYRKNHNKFQEVTNNVCKNATSTTRKTSNHKTISNSKRTRSKDLQNEIKRRGTPNIENTKDIPNGDIPSFSHAEQNDNTEYNIAYQEAEDLHSHRDEETASPKSVVVEETVVMPNLSSDSLLSKINNSFKVTVEEEEIEYETNTSSAESTGPTFEEAKKFSKNDKIVNHRTGKYKTKSKSKNVRFKDINKTVEQIDGHNADRSNGQKVLYRSEVIRDGYNTFNLADSNIELDRILTGPIGEIKDTNNSQYYENSDGNFNLFGFANSITPIFGDMSKDLMLVDKTKDLDSPLYDELDSKDARDYMKNEFKNNCTFPAEEPLNNLSAGGGPVSIKCSVTFNDFVDTRCITPVYNKLTKIRKKKFVIRHGIKCFIDPSDERLKMVTKVLVNKISDDTLLKVYKVIGHNTLRTCIKTVVVCSSTTKQVSTETKNALSKGSSYNDLHENVKEAAKKDQRTVINGQSPPRRRRGRPRKRHFEEEEQTHPRKRRKKAQTNKSMNLYLKTT